MSRFVILTPGRAGSTFLADSLNTHPEIFCEQEVFNRAVFADGSFNAYVKSTFWRRSIAFCFNREKLSTVPFNFPLKWLIEGFLSTKNQTRTQGFKLSLDQLFAYPHLFDILMGSFKIVYLTRMNKFRMVASLMVARKSGNYESFDGKKVWLDPGIVKEQIEQTSRWEQHCQERFADHLYLTHECLFGNTSKAMEELKDFLGVSSPIIPIATKKAHPDAMDDWVENHKEIMTVLGML